MDTAGTTDVNGAVWMMLARRWEKTMKAKALSDNTQRGYLKTAGRWSAWLHAEGYDLEPDAVKPHHVDDFVADIIETSSPANGAHHYRNLRVFFAWLVKRGEIAASPMDQTEPPNVPEKITPLLSDEEHAAILAVCKGKSFNDRRDTAIILMFIDTGLRISELASLKVDDIELTNRRFLVRGKGNRLRIVGFGNSVGLALARYLRSRAKHPSAALPELWLSGRRHRALSVNGIKRMLARRGKQAGVSGSLHAHRFRHDFSHRWRDAGGSEHGLMLIAGWTSTKMVRHYGKQAAARRALTEQESLGIADRLA